MIQLGGGKSTGSVAQDALLEGYQYTCHTGIQKMLKIEDLTTESCKSFIPVAIERATKKVESFEEERKKFILFSKDELKELRKICNSFLSYHFYH
jgi:hypothetical protein